MECLDICSGNTSRDVIPHDSVHIVGQWIDYYNTTRLHMERGHLPPTRDVPEVMPKLDRDQIVVRSHVGGFVKSFERKAA